MHRFLGLALSALVCAGCSDIPRTPASDVDKISRHPDRYVGRVIASRGAVSRLTAGATETSFRVTAGNFSYAFDVQYAGAIPGLHEGEEASFLGRVQGAGAARTYSGRVILITAITIKPERAAAVYGPADSVVAQTWLREGWDPERQGSADASTAAPTSSPAFVSAPVRSAAPAARDDSAGLKFVLDHWNDLPPEIRGRIVQMAKAAVAPPRQGADHAADGH